MPKLGVDLAYVTYQGLEGDGHDDQIHHGGPLRAVCLFSSEVIETMRGEGHPIFPGAAGENLTVSGIDWTEVMPGTRWQVGEQVELEITSYTTPCTKNARWFFDGDFRRMSNSVHPSQSRVYAKVLTEGHVSVGDQVIPSISQI